MFFMLTHVVKVRASLVAWSLAAMAVVALAFPAGHRARGGVAPGSTTWRGSCSAGRTTRSPSTSTTVPPAIGPRGRRVRRRRPVARPSEPRLARVAAVHVGDRAHRLLHADTDQGLPVPASRRPGGRRPGRPGPDGARPVGPAVAARPGRPARHGAGRRPGRRGPQPAPAQLEQRAAVHQPAVPGRFGRPARRPGGRHLDQGEPPGGRELLTLGPSMANVVQFYGHRRAYGLSVSPNPLNRNPSYVPSTTRTCSCATAASSTPCGTPSPRHARRRSPGSCWRTSPSTTASPSTPQTVTVTGPDGRPTTEPVIRVYEVLP